MEILNNLITIVDTGSVELNNDVEFVKHQCAIGRKASHDVARRLLKIKREELYTVCADTFSDFCTNYFTINKATGSKLTALAERFLVDENGNDVNDYDDYTISQLMEIRNCTSEQLALIKPTMTIKEIRDILHPKQELPDNSENNNESCDTATNNDNADNSNVGGITKTEPDSNEPHYVEGDNNTTPSKIVGDGFEIILADDGKSWVSAKITTVLGMKNYAEYVLSISPDPHTFDDDINITITYDKVWLNN